MKCCSKRLRKKQNLCCLCKYNMYSRCVSACMHACVYVYLCVCVCVCVFY